MFLLKGLMLHSLLPIINLVDFRDICIFGIQYGVYIFGKKNIEKCYLISLTTELLEIFLL